MRTELSIEALDKIEYVIRYWMIVGHYPPYQLVRWIICCWRSEAEF